VLIGIDGSTTKTGFSFGGPNDGSPRGGVWKLPGADELVFDRTLASVGDSMSMLIRMIRATHVVIEAPLLLNDSQHAAHTAMALIQLTGAMRAAATRAGCRVSLVAVSTVRKHFIGHGRLPGAQAKRAVQDRCRQLGWAFEDDNDADAKAVWAWGMAKYYPEWAPRGTPLFADRGAA